jgi:threonine synthase
MLYLGEGETPLVLSRRLGERVGCRRLYFKLEMCNPTGSFKDRGMALAFTIAKHYGIERVALPSAGNAGVAAAAYAEAAGLACRVFMPKSIPMPFIKGAAGYGAEIVLAGNTIAEAGAAMAADLEEGWFNLSTLKEPYRVEGKKTLGLEIAEQLNWSAPDVVVYPAGGGTGLVGIWKALIELKQLGWIDGPLPRMVAVQMAGCAPVVRAFTDDRPTTEPWPAPETSALGLNVPAPLGGAWMLKVLRESGGTALAVKEADLAEAGARLRKISGLPAGPEAAAAWRGYERLAADNWIRPGETTVVVVTGDDRRYS